MARKKPRASPKATPKPKSKTTSTHSTPRNSRPFSERHGSQGATNQGRTGFSLADEARWVSSHRTSAFDRDKKLRYSKIVFISAGFLEGTLPQQPPRTTMLPLDEGAPSGEPLALSDLPAAAAMAQMSIRSRSPSPAPSQSDSSEDEVVFQGRDATPFTQATAPSTTPTRTTTDFNLDATKTSSRKKCPIRAVAAAVTTSPTAPSFQSSQGERASTLVPATSSQGQELPMTNSDPDSDGVVDEGFKERLAGRSPWMTNTTPWVSRSKPGIGWLPVKDRPDMGSFLNGSANPANTPLDDYMENTREELHQVPRSFAYRPLDLDVVDDWDIDRTLSSDGDSSEEDSSSEFGARNIEDENEEDAEEEEDDDDDLEVDLDDERLARILQMQADIGISSDEVVLYGGDEFFDADIDLRDDIQRFDKPWKKRQNRSKRSLPSFPSATAMADALDTDPYNGFDVMDTERPSLRLKKKGRRGQLPIELAEDEEWAGQFQAMWDRDRAQKRVNKAERELLRKQGLLGRKGKGSDLSIKYKDGANINEIIEEVREFMFSDLKSLSLPPMEASRRAIIHQIVNQMGVSSKSRGEGAARFTVLSKTSRTMSIDDDFFDGLLRNKRIKNRLQAAPRAPNARKPPRPIVSYKDGDTVGASAPELGIENKGRMLLEKMGWSKGMALGALDNKGILHPIAHTVKTTKAGLQ